MSKNKEPKNKEPKNPLIPETAPGAEFYIGKNLFIRTVTNYFTGRLISITSDNEFALVEAAWIPATGRWGTMLAHGLEHINEVEPCPVEQIIYVNRASIVDWFEWRFELPREQKP
jgi:hypothetical protein